MSDESANVPDWPGPSTDDLDSIVSRLAEADGPADEAGIWPDRLWGILVEAGSTRWALPESVGGEGPDRSTLIRRYARVAEGSLTAAFILTQHDAGVRRLAASGRAGPWIDGIAKGKAFTTVGISQLTTSRRHGAAALVASESAGGGYTLDGVMPWVTGASRADVIVTGAVMADGRQLLIALPMDQPGVSVLPPFPLAALQASCTSEVALAGVSVSGSGILAGPSADVMASPGVAGTGGLETSALALGQARAALVALHSLAPTRNDLAEPIDALDESWFGLASDLIDAAEGRPDAPPPASIRGQANALVSRITQAHLTARKGTGFLRTDPAQRWARQALFFLIWSCPTPVAEAAIRDLAGLCSA